MLLGRHSSLEYHHQSDPGDHHHQSSLPYHHLTNPAYHQNHPPNRHPHLRPHPPHHSTKDHNQGIQKYPPPPLHRHQTNHNETQAEVADDDDRTVHVPSIQ